MKKVNLVKNLLFKVEMGTETNNVTDWIGDYYPGQRHRLKLWS